MIRITVNTMKKITAVSVSSTTNSAILLQKARSLAAKLRLPILVPEEIDSTGPRPVWILSYTDKGLQLLQLSGTRQKPQCLLYVDFIGGKNGYRLANNRTIQQPLARAVGIKRGIRPAILDATGGLGADSLVFASLGCQVVLCERNPVLYALLADGLQRAAEHDATASITDNLTLVHADSRNYLNSAGHTFDTVYLDPMYPELQKTALNSAEMRTIRDLVGDDSDIHLLWQTAMRFAKCRVVVKRPRKGIGASNIPPSYSQVMKSSRFDIYLVQNK